MMEKIKNKLALACLLLAACCFYSCSPGTFNDADKYKAYVKSNEELTEQKELSNIAYTLSYVPNAVIALRDLNAGQAVSPGSFYEYLEKTKDRMYFSFTISDAEYGKNIQQQIDSRKNYSHDLSYFNQVMEKNVQLLIDDKDSLQSAFVHMEPVSGLKPAFRFFVSFDIAQHPKIDKGFTFVLNDQLFGNGYIKFYYDQSTINDLPTLKL